MTQSSTGTVDGGLPLRVILGPCDDMRAEVFVRVPTPEPPEEMPGLSGELAGPECRRSITLPTGAPLVDLGAGGGGLLARAILTEPAFWTPDLPNLYRLTVRIGGAGRAVVETSRRIGLRRSGVRGRSLWLEGRRWVPRGIGFDIRSRDMGACRADDLAAVVADPPETLLASADECGVVVVAVAEAVDGRPLDTDTVVERIVTWAMHPSVVVAVLPRSFADPSAAAVAARVRRLKGTMLLARAVDGARLPPSVIPDGVDCLCVSLDAGGVPHDGWREQAPPVALLAWRRDGDQEPANRGACDRLQATLAAWGLADGRMQQPWDWAGYLVS